MPDVPRGNFASTVSGATSLDRLRGETRVLNIGGAEGKNGLVTGKTGWAAPGVVPITVGGGVGAEGGGANNEERWDDAGVDVAAAGGARAGGTGAGGAGAGVAGVAGGIRNAAAGVGAAAGAEGVAAETFISPSACTSPPFILSTDPGARVAIVGPSGARGDIGADGVPSLA